MMGKPMMMKKVVPPERVELSSLAPEASTLSTELQGLSPTRIPRAETSYNRVCGQTSGWRFSSVSLRVIMLRRSATYR